jgi:hypothetical protein
MGTFGLITANFCSILTQRKLEAALNKADHDTAQKLITQSIIKILKAGLTPNERRNLDELKELHRGNARHNGECISAWLDARRKAEPVKRDG